MKKKLLKILVICLVFVTSFFAFTACDGDTTIKFKLNFVVDGEIVKTIDTTGSEEISLPENPTKEGYNFDGWFWDKDTFSRAFTARSLLDEPLSSDMSVYAKVTKE